MEARTLLVVDDEIKLCRALGRILTNAGFLVHMAHDGESALRVAEQEQPVGVLLDLMMPGMSGREVCRGIRACSPQTKVMYLTARAEAMAPPEVFELRAEADALVFKPASSTKIIGVVRRMLSESALPSQHAMKI